MPIGFEIITAEHNGEDYQFYDVPGFGTMPFELLCPADVKNLKKATNVDTIEEFKDYIMPNNWRAEDHYGVFLKSVEDFFTDLDSWTPGSEVGKGPPGADGKSAYQSAVDVDGFEGTEEEWLESLKGADGNDAEWTQLTQEQYDQLETPDPNTLYVIVD